jgi:16S rRNA (uracil1498-N3)-methyltransferase
MNLFHVPGPFGELLELPEEEAHHAVRVLRLVPGDIIGLLDGMGGRAKAEIIEAGRNRVVVRIDQWITEAPEREARIHISVALTKQMDRFEWFVEKAVEIGVDRITPLITDRTERNRSRMDRLHKVMVSAMKQSQRAWLPQMDEPMALEKLLELELPQQRFFGWCEGEHTSLMQAYTSDADAIVVIGPEGDLTPEEAALLKEHGSRPVSLGSARLRTETAAIAACTWMSMLQQR